MKFDQHGNGCGLDDLYVLPEDKKERLRIAEYLKGKGVHFEYNYSNIKGQDWYGKIFIIIPFGENMRSEMEDHESIHR